MWLMLQQEKGDDYVLATGQTTLVRDFVQYAFKEVDIDLVWKGSGVHEQGVCEKTGRVYVEVDARYFRPTEVDLLIGDARKAETKLGWKHETKWQELCSEMVKADLVAVAKEQHRNVE
jgi:GDPmannose 4,6-dehydratase